MPLPSKPRRFALLGATLLLSSALSAADTRPNILLLVADDLGSGDLSCYGATKLQTPKIDALASEGVRMTDACASSAVCQPSRYSILTGEYTNRIQRKGEYQTYFRPDQKTIASVLRDAGYTTRMFGKWHNGFTRGAEPDFNRRNLMADKPGVTAHSPLDLGFDSYFGPPRSHNEPPFVFIETAEDEAGKFLQVYKGDKNDPIIYHPHTVPKERFDDYGYGYSTGAVAAHQARPDTQIDMILANKVAAGMSEDAKQNKPFFYYVPFTAPHVPIGPSKANIGRSQAGAYGDFIMQLDDCVGVITQALKELKLADNTLVIVTSDNGALTIGPAQHVDSETGVPTTGADGKPYPEMRWTNNLADHRTNGPRQGQKTDAWEGGHQVPFIAKWPGHIPANTSSDQLFGLTDILATVAAAADAAVPAGTGVDSLNQLPLLCNPAGQPAIRTEMLISGTKSSMLRYTDAEGTKWSYIPARGTGGESVQDTATPIPWGQPYRNQGWTNSDIETSTGAVKADAPSRQLYNLSLDPRQNTNIVLQQASLADQLTRRFNALNATSTTNRAPIVAQAIAAPTAKVGVAYSLQIAQTAITDPDNDILIYSASGLPNGLTFAPFTRTISGAATATGSFTVQVRAEDGRGGSVIASFTLIVAENVVPPPTPLSGVRDFIYTDFNANDVLKTGWVQANRNTLGTLRSTGTTRNGSQRSYSIVFNAADAYAGLFCQSMAFDTQSFASVTFWIHGGVSGGQNLEFQAVRANGSAKGVRLEPLKPGTWRQVTIPLSELGVVGVADLAHLRFVNRGAAAAPVFYVEDLSFDVLTQPLTILYSEGIRSGWTQQNLNGDGRLLNTDLPRTGNRSYAIRFLAAQAYAGMRSPDTLCNVGTQASLTCWFHGGSVGGQSLEIQALRAGGSPQGKLLEPLRAGVWQKVTVYLDELGILGATDLSAIRFVNRSGTATDTFYVDDVSLDDALPALTHSPN